MNTTTFLFPDCDLVHDPIASRVLGRDFYRLQHPMLYCVNDEDQVLVPAGFLTDGATVPAPFRWLIKPMGDHAPACLVHDWLCENPYFHEGRRIRRIEGDRIFEQALEELGVRPWRAWLMYKSVRMWTWIKSKFGFQTSLRYTSKKRQLESLMRMAEQQ